MGVLSRRISASTWGRWKMAIPSLLTPASAGISQGEAFAHDVKERQVQHDGQVNVRIIFLTLPMDVEYKRRPTSYLPNRVPSCQCP